MTTHKNDVTISDCGKDHKISITVRGPLSEYIEGMARYVRQVEGVKSILIYEDEPVIIAECQPGVLHDDDPEQIRLRIRIRNRCRDYVSDTTGYMTNIGENGNYVDLIEDVTTGSTESDPHPPRRGEGGGSGG